MPRKTNPPHFESLHRRLGHYRRPSKYYYDRPTCHYATTNTGTTNDPGNFVHHNGTRNVCTRTLKNDQWTNHRITRQQTTETPTSHVYIQNIAQSTKRSSFTRSSRKYSRPRTPRTKLSRKESKLVHDYPYRKRLCMGPTTRTNHAKPKRGSHGVQDTIRMGPNRDKY